MSGNRRVSYTHVSHETTSFRRLYRDLDTSDRRDRHGQHERVKERRDRLEHGDVLRQRAIPEDAEKEGPNQDIKQKHEGFGNHVGLIFSLDDFLEHFIM